MIREDSCGLEEIMPEPEPIKLRPFKPKCGNDTEVEHQLEKQAGNSEEEQHGKKLKFLVNISLSFTFTRIDNEVHTMTNAANLLQSA